MSDNPVSENPISDNPTPEVATVFKNRLIQSLYKTTAFLGRYVTQ